MDYRQSRQDSTVTSADERDMSLARTSHPPGAIKGAEMATRVLVRVGNAQGREKSDVERRNCQGMECCIQDYACGYSSRNLIRDGWADIDFVYL